MVLIATALVVMPLPVPAATADPVPPSEVILSTDKLTFDAGSTFTLTATVDQLLEVSSSTLTITDETNSVDVKQCTTGTECEIELSFLTGGAREYTATVNALTSDVVEVGRTPWTVALSADKDTIKAGESALLTAESNQDISATAGSYSIAIFDVTRGERLETCTSETICIGEVTAYQDSTLLSNYVAVVLAAADTSSLDLASAVDIQAISDEASVSRADWLLELTVGDEELWPNDETEVSVIADQDLDDTNGLYSIYIFEMSKDIFIAQCDTGAECSGDTDWGDVDPWGGYFLAVVAERLSTPPASFNDLIDQISWSNGARINAPRWETTLTTDRTELAAGEHADFTATVNMDLEYTEGRYEVYIVDWISGDIVKSCDVGVTCVLDFSFWFLGDNGYAGAWGSVVGAAGATGHYSNIQEWRTSSDTMTVDRTYWSAELEHTGGNTFTLTTDQDAGETNGQWAWYLFSGEDGIAEDVCYAGFRCVLTVAAPDPAGIYTVELAYANDPANTAESEGWIAGGSVEVHPPIVVPEGPTLKSGRPKGSKESSGGRNLAQGACQCGRADPVNTATGDFYLPETDLGIDGAGPVLALTRTYSVSAAGLDGPLGYGWVPNFGASLFEVVETDGSNPLPRQVEIMQENGGTLLFTRDGSSSNYIAPERVLAELSFDDVNHSWLLLRKDTEFLRFDADGLVSSVADPDGNQIEFDYVDGVLDRISGSGGRELRLTWTDGRVSSVTDSAGRSVSYAYDLDGNLVSFTAPDGLVTTYEYDAEHRIVAQVAPGGARTENTYDEDGRVTSQLDPIGHTTAFEYDEFAGTSTTVAPDGARTVDHYLNGLLVSQTLAQGTASEASTYYAYNEFSQISSILDPLAGLSTFTYDSNGNRLTQVDQLGRETEWTYGSTPSPLTKTDPLGRTTTMTYDSTGHPLTSETNGGSVETWTYNADGTLATYEDANGAVTTYLYDSAGRLTETTDAENRTTEIQYSTAGFPTHTTGSDSRTSVTAYDAAGRILEVEDANGDTTTYTYDAAGNIATTTNGEAETTTFTYDAAGQLLTTTDPEGGVTTLTYDLAGNVATLTDANANVTTTTYDHLGNVLTSTDALGRVTTTTYDLRGLLASTTTPSGAATTYERDAAGQILEVTDPLGKVTTVGYNLAGQPTTSEDPLGRTTTTTYDDDGRVLETVLADLSTQSYEYDDAGNVTKFTNADDLETTYTYTDTGLLASRTEPGGLETQLAYDSGGRVSVKTRPDGSEVSYSYDPAGQLETLDYGGTSAFDVAYTYDNTGRVLTIADGTGTTTLAYDDAGRLASEIDGSGDELTYTYDGGGRLVGIGYPGSRNLTYGYDDADQLTSATDWSSRTTAFSWTLDGALDTQTSPTGVVQDYERDLASQVSAIEIASPLASIASFDYVRDDAGQIIDQTSTFTGSVLATEIDHDLLGQLSGIERDDNLSPPTSINVEASSGGLLTTTDDGAALTYNSAQQVTERDPLSGPTVAYAYDDNGARTGAETSPAAETTYDYEPSGALAEIELPSQTITYETDARGLRQTRTAASTQDFLWSTARPLPLLMMDDEFLYIYGPSPTPIAQIDETTDDAIYLHSDLLGSVRATTDESGATLGTQTFTEFGSILSSTGALATAFGFTGNWTDEDTDLVHLRARDYDPSTGQFLTVDQALEDTKQPYAYAGNNPVQLTDHTGLDWLSDLGTNALAFGAGLLNGVTMGASDMIMRAVVPGYSCFVDANSGYFMAGDVVGMVGSTIALSAISAGSLGAAALGARLALTAAARTTAAAVRTGASAILRTGTSGSQAFARFSVNGAGQATLQFQQGSSVLQATTHAAERMTARNISIDTVQEVVSTGGFPYFHNEVWKVGYSNATVFVGSVANQLTTVIRPGNIINYVANLKKGTP